MLDDDARRALEEEAIALVSLSHSHHPQKKTRRATSRESKAAAVSASKPPSIPGSGSGSSGLVEIHPLLQQNKATLMARRDGSSAPHPHRLVTNKQLVMMRDGASRDPSPRCLSMSVFVDADGSMNMVPEGSKTSPGHHTLEATIVDETMGEHGYTNANLVQDHSAPVLSSGSGLRRDVGVSPTKMSVSLQDPHHISMQGLLETLKKKRKADDEMTTETTQPAATKLPRFRDVFEPAWLPELQPMPSLSPLPGPGPGQAMDHTQSTTEPLEDAPSSLALKCKYRTGKCTNTRALKSCGDHHNLCNYHRLRANANQRKLDRKKKVQRLPSSEEAASPVATTRSAAAPPPSLSMSAMGAPTAAAAAALASLTSSFMVPHHAMARLGSLQPSSSSPPHLPSMPRQHH